MKALLFKFLLIIACLVPSLTIAQDTTSSTIDTVENKYKRLYNTEDPLFKPKKEEVKDFKKKKDFWGFLLGRKIDGSRTRRGYARKGSGRSMSVESFRFLKKWEDGSPYVHYHYYFDPIKQKVVKKHKIDEEQKAIYKVLHGPYKKIKGEDTLLLGYFYKGMMHGRWIKQNKSKKYHFADTSVNFQYLNDKTYWDKGWPKDSELTYFKSDRTKLREVLPIMNGDTTGKFYRFYKSSHIQEKGEYMYGYKVKAWNKYYEGKRGTSKEAYWEFPREPFYEDSKNEDQFLVNKWNELGEETYPEDHSGEKAKKQKKYQKRGR